MLTFLGSVAGVLARREDSSSHATIVARSQGVPMLTRPRGGFADVLEDGMKITLEMHEETPLGIRFPPNVVLEVTEVDPVQKGQSVSSQFKPAILSNGIKVMVPPFLAVGERIVVDTAEATYMRRAD